MFFFFLFLPWTLFPFARRLPLEDCLYPGDIPFDLGNSHRVFKLPRGMLETEVEEFLVEILLFMNQFPFAQEAEILCLHKWLPLMMNLVEMGNLCEARRKASLALSSGTPSIS